MTARDAIIGKIRSALGSGKGNVVRERAVAERLAQAPIGVIPERGKLPPAERAALFSKLAAKAAASVTHVASRDDVPDAVADYLRAKNLPASVRVGDDPRLGAMPWAAHPTLELKRGASDGDDEVGVSHAFGAVAETGTLVLTSGRDNPTTINFLPEHHIVAVDADDIAGDLETVIGRIRSAYGRGELPRTVNLVTGPSRSADIEQTIVLGAHGPRALHIIVVGGQA